MREISRCRRCSGILKAPSFTLGEACRCETARGRKARNVAMSSDDGMVGMEAPASLQELLSDPGLVW